jgi:aminopeptidase N
VVDHPAMKATHTTSVTAPRKYQVVSNGLLVEETDLPGDQRRTVWRESVPISTWLMSLAVAPFAVDHFGSYRGIALSSWVFPQEHDAGVKAFSAHTQPVLEFYIDRIGPYPYEKLAQVQANGVGGGMELASSIFYGYGAAGAGRQLVAHEMAHQYFGDAVTEADWDDVWLSEGFATYFALLFQEFADGHDAFVDGVRRSKAQALSYAIANPGSTIVHDNLADISRVIANNAQVYQGGAQVLQNIRGVVGTQTFWEGIRSYYSRYMNGTATTDDFRRAIEGACRSAGDRCPADGRDLSWLFSQFLTRGGALQVQGTWSYDTATRQVQVTLEQTQTTGLYRMPIEVRVTTTAAAATAGRGGASGAPAQSARIAQVVQLTQQSQTFSIAIPAGAEVAAVELDPDAWVFGRLSLTKR